MLGYILSLERARTAAAPATAAEGNPTRKPYQPDPDFVHLDEQVRRYTNALTPVQRAGEFTMDDIIAHLKGRYAPRPHNSRVAKSLIRIGWAKRRIASSRSLPSRRVWLPPQSAKARS